MHIYRVDILREGFKLRVIARLVDRSISLEVKYQNNLAKISIHLVSLQKSQATSFLILMCMDEFNAKTKLKGLVLAYLYFQHN